MSEQEEFEFRARMEREMGAQAPAASRPAAEPISRSERVMQGLKDPFSGGAQLLTKVLPTPVVQAGDRLNNWLADKTGLVARLPEGGVDQQVRDQEREYQARRVASGESGFDGYRAIGNIASPANLGIARAIPAGATLGAKIGLGVAGGAGASALAPVTEGEFAQEKRKQMAIGGAFGGATPALVQGVSRVVSPLASVNPEVKMLREAGINPTIGQTLGGAANRLEQKATSVPFVGDAIAGQRRNAVEQLNRVAINRAVAPVGGQVDEIGTAGVQKAGDIISRAYDDALSQITGVKLDKQFSQDYGQLRQMAKELTPEMAKTFERKSASVLGKRVGPQANMTPETFKKVESELGQLASRYRGSSTASEQELGDAFLQLQALLREQAARTNPKAADMLRNANTAWANLVRVEGASKAAQNADGVFTPAQLGMAVRQADKSVRGRAVARGTALMQDLSSASQNVLGSTVPDSGTAGRLLPVATGGAAWADPMLTGAGLLGGLAMYSRPAQNLLNFAASRRPELAQPVGQALQRSATGLIPAGSQIGLGLMYQPSP